MNSNHVLPTIETVIKKEKAGEWEIIESIDFFKGQEDAQIHFSLFEKRRFILDELKKGQQPYICSFCKIPVKICGGQGAKLQSLHFRHTQHNEKCIFESNKKLTREEILCLKFNGAKESFIHEYLKNTIASILKQGNNAPLDLRVEQVYRDKMISKEWRRPDILAYFSDKKIAFELQISTTFVDVIVDRSEFYKSHNTYLLWIFDEFNTDIEKQTFSQTDILISNNYNVFVFDVEAQALSRSKNELYLKCYYIDYSVMNNILSNPTWQTKLITLDDLCFQQDYSTFYFDSKEKREQLVTQIELDKSKKGQAIINKDEVHSYYRNTSSDSFKHNKWKYSNLISLAIKSEEENVCNNLDFQLKNLDDVQIIEFSSCIEELIKEWYFNSNSYFFLDYIFRQSRIIINFDSLALYDTSPLDTLLIRGFEKHDFYKYILSFFKKGYCPKIKDKKNIESYIGHILKMDKIDEDELDSLEKHSIALQYIRLYNACNEQFNVLYDSTTRSFILRILSVLTNKIIGSKSYNFKSLTNDVISFNSEFSHLYIIAMHTKNGRKNDYGENGKKIINQIHQYKLSKELNDIFPIIFPNVDWKVSLDMM